MKYVILPPGRGLAGFSLGELIPEGSEESPEQLPGEVPEESPEAEEQNEEILEESNNEEKEEEVEIEEDSSITLSMIHDDIERLNYALLFMLGFLLLYFVLRDLFRVGL